MFKNGVISMILVTILAISISCKTETPLSQNVTILAPSPMETTDGSLIGDGWKSGQTPQSYNTGPNQVPASEEEVQRVKKELTELEETQ